MIFLHNNTRLSLSSLQLPEITENFRLIRHGIEKEGLRITPCGKLSQSMHPIGLGSALRHPYITTDYSEALLEFITPVFTSIDDTVAFLKELHQFTLEHINNDIIWASSMPARLEGNEKIPVARYGTSNAGKMKHIYRLGLWHRYGKPMQTIAGIHYNFSLPSKLWENQDKDISDGYFGLIRNFNRYSWLLMYLFGASPAIDKSFLPEGQIQPLEVLSENTLYLPFATSLRMSDLGYSNKIQGQLNICYNGLKEYISSLSDAIHTPNKEYERIGLKTASGEYQQLNTNILQIENEYYSTIRPKRVALKGEKPLEALKNRGVEYIEVRCLDINPLQQLGIDCDTAGFMDTFLTFCHLKDSPYLEEDECNIIKSNFSKTVQEGRKPDLQLDVIRKNGRRIESITLQAYGLLLIEQMQEVAGILDETNKTTIYSNSLFLAKQKLKNPDLTPSAQVLNKIKEYDNCFISAMQALSQKHSNQLRTSPLNSDRKKYFQQLVTQSHDDQLNEEQTDTSDFDTYLREYFNTCPGSGSS